MSWMVVRSLGCAGVAALALSACGTLRGVKRPPLLAVPPAPETTAPAPAAPAPPTIRPPPAPPRTSCVPKGFAHGPKYPDTDAALLDAGGAADRYQLMAAGRLLRSRRLSELEKIVDGCR